MKYKPFRIQAVNLCSASQQEGKEQIFGAELLLSVNIHLGLQCQRCGNQGVATATVWKYLLSPGAKRSCPLGAQPLSLTPVTCTLTNHWPVTYEVSAG